jgi:hypothetical protein
MTRTPRPFSNRSLVKTAIELLMAEIAPVTPRADGARWVKISAETYDAALMAAAAINWKHGGKDVLIDALERMHRRERGKAAAARRA